MKFTDRRNEDKAELQLTSMIDVIFLLLIFFIMTFKIVAQEGDFNIRMPLGGGAGADSDAMIPVKLRLRANSAGELADIIVDGTTSFGTDFAKLRGFILQLTGGVAPPDPKDGQEVEIDLDYDLRYQYVVEAITAVTGQLQGDEVVKLIERVKFAPPRPPQ